MAVRRLSFFFLFLDSVGIRLFLLPVLYGNYRSVCLLSFQPVITGSAGIFCVCLQQRRWVRDGELWGEGRSARQWRSGSQCNCAYCHVGILERI